MNFKTADSNIHFDPTRELILGKYYPITPNEVDTFIRKGLGKDLINFVSDRGYTFMYPVAI